MLKRPTYFPPITYFVTESLWLSLESYYNAGLTPERAKEIIESLRVSDGALYMRCEPSGLNRNWIVHLPYDTSTIQAINNIQVALTRELNKCARV